MSGGESGRERVGEGEKEMEREGEEGERGRDRRGEERERERGGRERERMNEQRNKLYYTKVAESLQPAPAHGRVLKVTSQP